MTTIVAIQGDSFAVVAVDSRISAMESDGFATISTLGENSGKVAVNGKYLLGAAGDVRAINILHHAFIPPTPPSGLKGKKLDQFFTVKFIPALRDCFEKQGYASPDNNEDKQHIAEQASTIIAVVSGTVYVVDSDYAWSSDSNGIYALGSGSAYAMGALSALTAGKKIQTVSQAKSLALKALSVSAKFDPYTGPPFRTHVQDFSK
jgi:ATP-dependent protease HslVU (ClpYQ) peptidase subunit